MVLFLIGLGGIQGQLSAAFVNGVLMRRYPKEEFLEWGRDAHGPHAVHEV